MSFFPVFFSTLSALDSPHPPPGNFLCRVSTDSLRNPEPHALIAKELKLIQINMLGEVAWELLQDASVIRHCQLEAKNFCNIIV